MWIYEHPDWKKFTQRAEDFFDHDCLNAELLNFRNLQQALIKKFSPIKTEEQKHILVEIHTQELISSWAIEGEHLDAEEIRSSFAKKIGLDRGGLTRTTAYTEALAQVITTAIEDCHKPLTKERLFEWHRAIFSGPVKAVPKEIGRWRSGPVYVGPGGPIGREKTVYIAPHANMVEEEMKLFLAWCASTRPLDLTLKAGIAHLWFECIHPFADGNGRIGRVICDHILARSRRQRHGTHIPYYTFSGQIRRHRKEYWAQLKQHSDVMSHQPLDITPWLTWFISCLKGSIGWVEEQLENTFWRNKIWEKIDEYALNDRQLKALKKMINMDEDFEGNMNEKKYINLNKCTDLDAKKDLRELSQLRILQPQRSPQRGHITGYVLLDDEEQKPESSE